MTCDYAAGERFAVIDLGDGTYSRVSRTQIAGTLAQNPGARAVRRGLGESTA